MNPDQTQLLIDAGEATMEMAKSASIEIVRLRGVNEELQNKVATLTQELNDSKVEVVKVASSHSIPQEMVSEVADTLVSSGFIDRSEHSELSSCMQAGGVGALVATLKKMASTSIPMKPCVPEGEAVSLNKKASKTTNLDKENLAWREELDKSRSIH